MLLKQRMRYGEWEIENGKWEIGNAESDLEDGDVSGDYPIVPITDQLQTCSQLEVKLSVRKITSRGVLSILSIFQEMKSNETEILR